MGDIGMIKGGACLVALARRGRRGCSRTQSHQCRSRGLLEKKRGGEAVNTGQTSITKKNKAKRGARGDLTQY